MTKKETLWRYLCHQAISQKKFQFVQKELAQRFGYSLSTVHNALKDLRASAVVKVTGRNFVIVDKEKFIYLWATHHRLNKEIVYSTFVDAPVKSIESQVPAGALFAAYSAFTLKVQSAPADYDKVHIYAEVKDLPEIKSRFPPKSGYQNFFVLKCDAELKQMSDRGVAPLEQIFVDIWNLSDWYAKDFLSALKDKLFQ